MNQKLHIATAVLAILLNYTAVQSQAPNWGVANTIGLLPAVGTVGNVGFTTIALAEFQAQKSEDGSGANLTWNTLTESNSDYFLIERSSNGIYFESIVKLLAAGNSDHMIAYTFADEAPASGSNYYRLQAVDRDGAATISKVATLTFSELGNSLQVYPNPFSNHLVLRLERAQGDVAYAWQFTDAMGKQLKQTKLENYVTNVDMTTISNGIYFYRLTRNGEIIQSGRLIAQH